MEKGKSRNEIRAILISWSLIIIVLLIDMITTIYALEFREGFSEANPIGNYFFNLGSIGYILFIIFDMVFIFGVLLFVGDLTEFIYLKSVGKKPSIKYKIMIYSIFTSVLILMDILTIINNIILLY